MSNFVSYDNLIRSRNDFRRAGTNSGSEFNIFDTPNHKYFKLFFYFNNGDETGDSKLESSNGLLAPTWLLGENANDDTYYMYNSAWSYLKMNADDSRADLLQQFVNLLSNISSESPWYFSEVSGLETGLERKVIDVENFNIEAARPKITIKCLPDSVDDRIGTLMDLYRSIVWDWVSKREMLPANLRKFDMGILIFETPNYPFNVSIKEKDIKKTGSDKNRGVNERFIDQFPYIFPHDKEYEGIGGTKDNPRTSYKYIELHNCEFDYNSTKAAYSALNNKDGFTTEYNIDIFFDDCYETRYNEFLVQEFGDFIEELFMDKANNKNPNNNELASRSLPSSIEMSEESKKYQEKQLKIAKITQKINNSIDNIIYGDQFKAERLDVLEGHTGSKSYDKGFLGNAIDQVVSTVTTKVNSLIKKAVLGNIYTFSLTKIGDQLSSFANGNVLGAARDVSKYIRDSKRNNTGGTPSGNLFPAKKITPTVKNIGNLYKGNTIANNL